MSTHPATFLSGPINKTIIQTHSKPVNHEVSESIDPEELGEKLAKESLNRLQAALAAA